MGWRIATDARERRADPVRERLNPHAGLCYEVEIKHWQTPGDLHVRPAFAQIQYQCNHNIKHDHREQPIKHCRYQLWQISQ